LGRTNEFFKINQYDKIKDADPAKPLKITAGKQEAAHSPVPPLPCGKMEFPSVRDR
jgi:hypothetical protein